MAIQIPEDYQSLYENICHLYEDLESLLKDSSFPFSEVTTVEDLQARLKKRLFTLVFVGGFNTGKSSLINVLFQKEVFKAEENKSEEEKKLEILCKEDATPSTSKIHILKWGPQKESHLVGEAILEEKVPNPKLRDLHMEIVDTPGTDSTHEIHDEITKSFIPQADMVFFVFSVDQPFTRTEKEFLELIYKNWKRELLFILNKIDTKRNPKGEIDFSAIEKVIQNIEEKSEEYLSRHFRIYPVSAQMVKEGLYTQQETLLEMSGVPKLEEYISHQLKKILHQIKLKSALQTGLAIVEKSISQLEEAQKETRQVVEGLEKIRDFVLEYWNLKTGESSRASHNALFRRFDELSENINSKINHYFNFPQLVMAMFRGGSDSLIRNFRQDLKGSMESFQITLRDELENLVHHFTKELQLVFREEKLEEKIPLTSRQLSRLKERLVQIIPSVMVPLEGEEKEKLLDKLLKALLISLGAFVFGAISLISSLGAIPTNPLGALTGAILLGGGLIGGSTVFLGLRKNHVKKEFSHEIMALKGEFRGLIKSKIEGDLLDNFLMPILEEWKEKDQEISQKIQSLSQIQERVIQLQRELKSLEQGEE